ncbi:MAG: riboflavin synthase [Pseudomonadota bacterium]|uniref:Riboflavin synthase n=1 Tax=Candidatus Desulfatibia profunda TaxID=2841695 RepID=A0A8J6TMS7_9BACT|nr:riboflavin synthase [Candidatus Desulfatibia profunda]MBL7179553.1 riboflavin synthase [Desulfobacterales bacterium]MBU0698292.1 riboflavin synthase [Pseudomonadota bacterium]
MFTGIIEGFGTIREIRPAGQGKRLTIEADFFLDQTKIGDSIAVSGACLTAVALDGKRFKVDVSPETLAKTTFGRAKIGERVNLERALRLSDRLDGHLVSGHIDGLGTVKAKRAAGNAVVVTIGVPESLLCYMITKGSVAVDGISLTINDCGRDSFTVSIIPHTARMTTIGFKNIEDSVNIETDMIGKYVERFVVEKYTHGKEKETGKDSIDMQFLAKTGFI